MAKKKEQELRYLQLPLPEGGKEKTTVRIDWSGLNMAQTLDTGELSLEVNLSTTEAPYLTPSQLREKVYDCPAGTTPNSLFGFGDFLILVYSKGNTVTVEHITDIDKNRPNVSGSPTVFRGEIADGTGENAYEATDTRCVVMMNAFTGTLLAPEYTPRLIMVPDGRAMDFRPRGNFSLDIVPTMPMMKYATVHLSRLFGVSGGMVYASGFNNYSVWELDNMVENGEDPETPEYELNYSKAHAWASAAQSNVRATGDFTGITTYLNSVVTFKRDYMHEISGSSNPFRINDIYAEGATDNRNIAEVDGNLIFTSDDAVKVYTGGNPRIISYKLGVNRFREAVAGTDGRRYYLFCKDDRNRRRFFVYDTVVMQWAEEEIDKDVIAFAHNDVGMYMLTKGGQVYRLDTRGYYTERDWWQAYEGQEWAAETDLSAGRTIDIKHIQKLQILVDLAPGSEINAYLLRDGESFLPGMEPVYTFRNEREGGWVTRTVRVVPRRTAHWGSTLRLAGTGFCRVYQAEVTMKGGGELYV